MKMNMADNSDNSGGDLPLSVIREKNEENGNSTHTPSDISEKPNAIDRDKVKDKENVIISKGEDDDNASDDSDGDDDEFVNETEQATYPHSSSALVSLPHLFPLGSVPQRITPDLLLATLREEPGVPDPDAIHRDCYDAMNALKEEGVLNKHVLSEDEAAVLCAIPMLVQLKSGSFSIQKMAKSCNVGTPSKLFVIMLTALRKLPRYKGIMYIESEVQSEEEFEAKKRRKDEIIQDPIYVATKGMSSASGTTDTASPREVFRVEEGWGYDISDFALERDESGRYVISYVGDIVIIEPWQGFEVVNSGIYRSQERISIVPVKKVGSKLAYCTEIVPNVSSHAVRIMKEGMDDVNVVRNMLNILTAHPFDTQYDDRTTFRKDGGIECLIDCYNKHNALRKEVIACLENAIGEAEPSAYILLDKGFIKTVADLTFENIGDPVLCQSSSAIIKTTCSSFTNVYNFDKLFQDIRGFELILELLRAHKTNASICSNMLAVLFLIFSESNKMRIPEDTLKSLFDSGLFEIVDFILEVTRDETLINMCNVVLSAIHIKRLDKIVGFDSNNYANLLYHQIIITSSIINQFETNEERLEELSKKLSVIDNETITGDDIKAALQGIGISDPKKILDESKKVYDEYKDELNKSCILSEEEIIAIASYIYEDKENKDMSPYRIINKKLRDENVRDQMNNEKSYLQLLLRALRKLPRTEPQTLYRGVSDDKEEYVENGGVEWKSFSSTTTTMKRAQSFLTNKETNEFSGTLFEIRNVWGYNIKDLSRFDEDEVLLEPMMKFVVKDVKKQGSLTRVVLEPKKEQSFLFIDSIPPSCTQRIILNLKSSTDPKEICRLCDILRKVYMDDDTSPYSRPMFREHGGAILLCDLFIKHKKYSIGRVLAHVMDPRDKMTNAGYIRYISRYIYASPTEETIDEDTNLLFLNFLSSLNAKNIQTTTTITMVKGFSTLINRLINNKSLCLKVLKTFSSNFFDAKDSYQIELDVFNMAKKIIKTHQSDPEICKVGCLIMNMFASSLVSDEHREQEDEEDCIKVVAEVMKMHINDADTCMYACGVLTNIVGANAREAGGIGIVLSMIRKHIDNVDVCRRGCGALPRLILNNDANQKEAIRLNGIKIVLDATSKYVYDELACVFGCGALGIMIDEIQDNPTKNRLIKTVLSAMNTHVSNEEICSYGCTILYGVSVTYDIQENPIRIEVIETVLKAMNAHINNEKICIIGCYALDEMIDNCEIQDDLTKIRVIETMLNTMNTHINNEKICKIGCYALSGIISNYEIQDNLIRVDVIRTMLIVINTHISNGEICKYGCYILDRIILNCDIQDNLIKVAVIKTVLNAISTYINNETICRIGCTILWNISEANSVVQKIACENGCVDVLLKVLEAHTDNKDICGSCCGALGVILSSQDLHSKYCTDDVRSIIGECYANHEDSTKVLQFLLGLMREEDSKVREAIEGGVCTKEAFPKCPDDCGSDENAYCPTCCVQQRAFRCRTCDKDKILLYCEMCWRRDHQGHECEEFFCPVRCATKTKMN